MGDAVADEAAVEGRECAECLEAIAPGTEVTLRARGPDGSPLVVCDACAANLEARYQTETEQPDVVHGVLLGLILGFVGAIVWFGILATTGWEMQVISLGLGYVVGWGVKRGAGGKRGRKLQWLAVAATLVVMVFTEYLIGRYAVSRMLVEQGYPSLPLLVRPDRMLAVLITMLSNVTTLALWGFAFLVAWTMPRRQRLQRA
jgi:hypothetical protein